VTQHADVRSISDEVVIDLNYGSAHSTLKNYESVKGVKPGRCGMQRVDVQFGNLRVGQQQPTHSEEDLDPQPYVTPAGFCSTIRIW